MTISTTSSSIVVAATGASSYAFPFIGVAASDIVVVYTTMAGTPTTIQPTAYTVFLNAPVIGEIWGVGGTISPSVPSNYSSGSLTISRILPLMQEAEVSNQGNQYPIVTEQALDILCMEIQQISARTGQFRSTWITGATYNYGDIVIDGVNGANTTNWYMCISSNTSGTWATDLANGDWVLILNLQGISNPGTVAAGGVLAGNYPNPIFASFAADTILGNNTSASAAPIKMTVAQTQVLLNAFFFQETWITSSGNFTTPANSTTATLYQAELQAPGGGGGGTNGIDAGAGGGGAGEYARWQFSGVAPATNLAAVIGAGGSGGSSTGGNGGTGVTSSFNGVTCIGGTGSAGSTAAASGPYMGGIGGTGGTGSANRIAGGQGSNGIFVASTFGLSGDGSDSMFGFGGKGFAIAGSGNVQPSAASGYGAGGAGAGGATLAGTAGSPGLLIVRRMSP